MLKVGDYVTLNEDRGLKDYVSIWNADDNRIVVRNVINCALVVLKVQFEFSVESMTVTLLTQVGLVKTLILVQNLYEIGSHWYLKKIT